MTPNSQPPSVIHNTSQQHFELRVHDQLAYLSYTQDGGRVVLDHTYVPDTLRGQGLAGVLAQAALEEARGRGWKVVPQCSFVATYIQRHPEFEDLVARPDTP
jgi:predicted GNAT family acetyltransferase